MNYAGISLIARRYLKAAFIDRKMRVLLISCIVSISMAVAAMIIVHGINCGFHAATIKSLKGIYPDFIMQAPGGYVAVDAIEAVIKKEFPQLTAVSPYVIEQGLCKVPDKNIKPAGLYIKIIYPDREARCTHLQSLVTIPHHDLIAGCTVNGRVIIGHLLAKNLDLALNDKLEVIIAHELTGNEYKTITIPVVVGGIIKTGLEELDTTCMIMHYQWYAQHVSDAHHTHIGLACSQNNQKSVHPQLTRRFAGLVVQDWLSLNPYLLEALTLEQYAFFAIMLIITAIACITIVAVLILFIYQKNVDIAVLYLHGASYRTIKHIFMSVALLINSMASCIGIALAILIKLFLYIHPITLPDAYYISTVPMEFSYTTATLVFCFTTLVTLLVSYGTTYMISEKTLLETLKHR